MRSHTENMLVYTRFFKWTETGVILDLGRSARNQFAGAGNSTVQGTVTIPSRNMVENLVRERSQRQCSATRTLVLVSNKAYNLNFSSEYYKERKKA